VKTTKIENFNSTPSVKKLLANDFLKLLSAFAKVGENVVSISHACKNGVIPGKAIDSSGTIFSSSKMKQFHAYPKSLEDGRTKNIIVDVEDKVVSQILDVLVKKAREKYQ